MHTKIKRGIKTTFTNERANQYLQLEIYGDMERKLSIRRICSWRNENDHFRLQFCSTSIFYREDDKDKSNFFYHSLKTENQRSEFLGFIWRKISSWFIEQVFSSIALSLWVRWNGIIGCIFKLLFLFWYF